MKYAIIYWSRHGNNRRIAEHLAEKLRSRGEVNIFKPEQLDPTNMPLADFYIFSAASEKFSVQTDMKKLMKSLQNMKGRKYGLVNTHAMKKGKLAKMDGYLKGKEMVKVAEIDLRMGKEFSKGQGLEGDWEARLDGFAGKF